MDDFDKKDNDFPENGGNQDYGSNLMPQSGSSQPQNSIDPQYDYSQYQYSYDNTATVPKKSTGWVVPVVIAGAVAVGAAGALLIPSVRNSVKLAFTSPEEYYAEAERKTAEKAADDLWKFYLICEEQQKKAASPDAGTKKADITVTPGSAFYEDYFPDNTEEMMKTFRSVGISTEAATSSDLISLLLTLNLNGSPVISAEVLGKTDASAAYARLLESGTDKYVKYTASDLDGDIAVEPDASVFFNGETITKEKIDAVTARYTELYLDAVTAAEWNKKSVCTVENVSCPAVEIRVQFSETEYLGLIEKIAEQAKTDEDIISIVEAMGGRREDYVTEIDELLSGMNLEASDEPFADMTVYINSDGEIIGRTFRDCIGESASEYTFSTAVNDGSFASQLKLATTEGEGVELLLKGSYENGSANGYCDLIARALEDEASSSEKLQTASFRVEFENVKYDFLDSKLYGGKYSFTSPELEEIEATLELDGDMENGSFKAAVIYEGENYVNIDAVYTSTDETRSISLPAEDKCVDDLGDAISDDFVDVVMENICNAAGVSEDELSELIFGASYSDYDDDDDWQPEVNEDEYDYDYEKNGSEYPAIPSFADYENITIPSVDLSQVVYTANGEEITIPCKALSLPDKLVRTETPLDPYTGKYFFNDDYTVTVYIENEKKTTLSADVSQCKFFSVDEGGQYTLDLRINGIGIGSKPSEIEAALGTPSEVYDYDGEMTYYYYDKSTLTLIEILADDYGVYRISIGANIKYMDQ